MIFSLDVRRARKGDCLLVHYGSKEDPGLAVIDGGPAQVYGPSLKPRLDEIKMARGLKETASLPVDLLMVSHIDDDHINGILQLTKDLVDASDASRPLPYKIRSVWHNTFDDIIGNDPDKLLAAVTASFGPAALSGEPDTDGLDPATAAVFASVGQGFRLRDDIRRLKLRINPEFNGKLIMATGKEKGLDMGKGLKCVVAGPMKADLAALQSQHDAFLKKREGKAPEASLAAFTDRSVANLSSLVVLAEVEKKRMLLTGDARGDKILKGLELAGALKAGGTMHVEILKMPHHGSDRNMDRIFFRRITADHYVFSGNGEYGNPERETLQMLLDERGDEDFTIHVTYPIEDIDVERKNNCKAEQAKEKARQKTDKKLKIRENWSPKKHGLKAFFAANKAFAKKVRIVGAGKPHVINLLDPL